MFGYVRPNKAELKIKEFVRYRSLYCGICKTISRKYGQLPRLATGYDLTFLALFLSALEPEDQGSEMQACILHPFKKTPMALSSESLDFCAAAAVLLSRYKLLDNIADSENVFKSRAGALAFRRASRKAASEYKEMDGLIGEGMKRQAEAEANFTEDAFSPEGVSEPFSKLLGGLTALSPPVRKAEEQLKAGLVFLGENLGAWIYLIDALDDREEDRAENRFNPLLGGDEERKLKDVLAYMQEKEDAIDASAGLLPFYRDAAILKNIIQEGLPSVREAVIKGEKLRPL